MENTNPETSAKACLECDLPLGRGLEDRKYCNDICRTAYYNRRRKAPNNPIVNSLDREMAAIQRVQDILLENRVKLYNMQELFGHTLSPNEFYGFGVNLKYFTSEYRDEGNIYRMCFDHGDRISGEDVYLIYAGAEIYFN
jgi:hypothetical protein